MSNLFAKVLEWFAINANTAQRRNYFNLGKYAGILYALKIYMETERN